MRKVTAVILDSRCDIGFTFPIFVDALLSIELCLVDPVFSFAWVFPLDQEQRFAIHDLVIDNFVNHKRLFMLFLTLSLFM